MIAFALLILIAADAGRAGAEALFRAGRYRDAALAYIALLRAAPQEPDLLEGAGRSLLALASPEQAIPFFEREVALRPLRRDASRWLSEAYIGAGKFQQAQQLLTRMTVADPSDGGAWAQLGAVFYKNGYYSAAIEAFNRALASPGGIGPPSARNRVEVLRAISLVETGASAEATKILPELLARPENSANLDLVLSSVRLLYETGAYTEALRLSDRSLALAPANAAVHFWRARLLQQNGEIPGAISEAERSRELDPASPAPRGLLVRLYQRSGRADDAAREAAWLREHEAAATSTKP